MTRHLAPRHRVALMGVAVSVVLAPMLSTGTAVGGEPPGSSAWRDTRTLTRERVVSGETRTVDTRNVTVTVSKTENLRGRERVRVRWTGAHPSGGRAANPFGETGLAQEYPVVVLQCRGRDDASLPADRQLSPETCWTSTRQQRTQSATDSAAVWRHDLYATEAERAQKSGVTPYPSGTECSDVSFLSTHITPFVGADKSVHLSCTAETMAPEAAVGAAYPPSEVAAFTGLDGSGEAMFEVRSDIENESLGCNHTTDCSIVVIPIMGISCMDTDPLCNKFGRFAPGSSNFAGEGVDDAVSPVYWWAASNWRNRFTVPISFGLAPDACDVLDSRAPTAFYGSELMSQAALQWAPAYCLRKDRFKFQHNRMSDAAAFALMEQGQAPAAFVSGERPTEGADPVAYAPTAVTGFAVSYVIDKPDNAGEYTDLRLNPRLLAKLLTQSYPASALGQQHPGMAGNPLSMNLDPEFQALNPGLDTRAREAAATVLSLSQSSDVISTLTAYIAQDKDALAFLSGKADQWGMRVNPSYRGIDLPVAEWPLLDTFVPKTDQECLQANPAVYLSQVAAPVSYLRTIAEAVLDAWPNVQTRCEKPTSTDPYKLGRAERQGIGARFMLGITSLGDARRFELRSAALETTARRYVEPTDTSLAAAVQLAEQKHSLGTFHIDENRLARTGAAYPATMVVYTAARTSGLAKPEAAKVAQFVRIATSQGQQPGGGNGELPGGFLPLRASGPTADLYRAAQRAATAIEQQRGAGGVRAGSGSHAPAGGRAQSSPGAGLAPGAAAPPGLPAGAAGTADAPAEESAVGDLPVGAEPAAVATVAQTSQLSASLLPMLLFVGLLAGLLTTFSRLLGRRGGRA